MDKSTCVDRSRIREQELGRMQRQSLSLWVFRFANQRVVVTRCAEGPITSTASWLVCTSFATSQMRPYAVFSCSTVIFALRGRLYC